MKSYQSKKQHQRGFTLVEIAIVLMIIGLLIGGILRGQELIQSARVRNLIDQKSSIHTAYLAFIDRYRMTPGDLTPAQATAVGNGVAAVNAGATAGGDGIFLIGNAGAVSDSPFLFQNLTAAGFLSCSVCTTTAGAAADINNSPTNVFGGVVRMGYAAGDVNGAANTYITTVATPGQRLVLAQGAGIASTIAGEVDRKADDSNPTLGSYRHGNFDGNAGGAAVCFSAAAGATPAIWIAPAVTNCEGAWLL